MDVHHFILIYHLPWIFMLISRTKMPFSDLNIVCKEETLQWSL